MGRPTHIQDDLGKPCRMTPLARLRWDARRADPAFAAAVNRADRAVIAPANTPTIVAFALLFLLVYFAAVIVLSITIAMWIIVLIGIPLLYVVMYQLRRRVSPRTAKRAADILLTDGVCPACAYNLAGLPDADGVTVCSECGAAWRTTRIVRRHTFADRSSPSRAGMVRRVWEWAKAVEFQGPTSIKDDAGHERPVVSPRLTWPSRTAEGDRRDRLVAARAEMLTHGRGQRQFSAVVMVGCFLMPVSIKLWVGIEPDDAPFLLLFLWNAVQGAFIVLRGAQGITTAHIRGAMLRRRLCPSCGADLPDAAPSDELCHCVECGAAWRLAQSGGPMADHR